MRQNKQRWFALFLIFVMMFSGTARADSSSSTNYKVDQTFFGSGGELDAASANYRAKQTLGELGVGLTESASYRAYAGFNTTDEPYIEFFVNADTLDLGYLDPAQARTTAGTFYIRAWQTSGYVIQTVSEPPTNTKGNNHLLTPLTAGGTSSPGTEQFGINLVDNSSPNVGSNPVQVPDSSFSFGQAAAGYNTPNQFKYNVGDTVALSTQSTSITIYTISFLYNISVATPSGAYVFNHDLVAFAKY